MKKILFLLLIPFLSLGQDIEDSYFTGTNRQDVNSEYPVDITITKLQKSGVSGTVNYNSLGCSGELVFVDKTSDYRYVFVEKLTKGNDVCINNGLVVLEPINNNQFLFYWYYEDGRLGSATVLNRFNKR